MDGDTTPPFFLVLVITVICYDGVSVCEGSKKCKWVLRVELRSHNTEPDHIYRLGV